MKLGEFIEKFIEHNSLIRLLIKTKNGYKVLYDDWDKVSMEWEVLKQQGIYRHFINNNVIGIASILVSGPYPEAINIVIEKLEIQPILEDKYKENKNPQTDYNEAIFCD